MPEEWWRPDGALEWTFAALYGALILGSLITALRYRGHRELVARVKTWWIICTIVAVAILAGRIWSLVFMGFVSFLALKEFFSMIPTRRADRRVLFWAYLAIPVQFYWIHLGWYGMFVIFIPVYVFLFLPIRMILQGDTDNFLGALSRIHWGVMTTVFCLSHASYLLVLDPDHLGGHTGPELLLFLVIVTQFNDIFQYLWGKSLGRRKIVPTVSPGKTWAGLTGAVATTTLLSWGLAPWLTPLDVRWSLIVGLIISLGGFVGDVTISALKRDFGTKDSGSILPGHGGVLDRIDSLFYTAPLFFHLMFYLYFPPLT